MLLDTCLPLLQVPYVTMSALSMAWEYKADPLSTL